jgi:hypothetical protein
VNQYLILITNNGSPLAGKALGFVNLYVINSDTLENAEAAVVALIGGTVVGSAVISGVGAVVIQPPSVTVQVPPTGVTLGPA